MSFIELKNICKKYKGNDRNSVTDFNLQVEEKNLSLLLDRLDVENQQHCV